MMLNILEDAAIFNWAVAILDYAISYLWWAVYVYRLQVQSSFEKWSRVIKWFTEDPKRSTVVPGDSHESKSYQGIIRIFKKYREHYQRVSRALFGSYGHIQLNLHEPIFQGLSTYRKLWRPNLILMNVVIWSQSSGTILCSSFS